MNILTREQHAALLREQHAMNALVYPDYLTRNFPWHLAVAMEIAEAIDHHGWKWWKHSEPNLEQLQMELVDVWHFIMSAVLVEHDGIIDECVTYLDEQSQCSAEFVVLPAGMVNVNEITLLEKLTYFMGMATTGHLEIPLFADILYDCDMTWSSLYRTYLIKNTLNVFRQHHGYKTGEYIKIWHGSEDNVHATALGIQLANNDTLTVERLTAELEKIYATVEATRHE